MNENGCILSPGNYNGLSWQCNELSVSMVYFLHLITKRQQFIHKYRAPVRDVFTHVNVCLNPNVDLFYLNKEGQK